MKDEHSCNTLAPVGRHPVWLVGLVLVLGWQSWLTLGLFHPQGDIQCLLDDEPILSGRHPLHLYHGYLGACALLERGSLSCYDPAFHAGYPKTPVFDSGSRPAELALALAGGRYCPAVYKLALAGFCLGVPVLFFLAARGACLSRGVSLLATVLGLGVFWGRSGREALEAGDLDLLLAAIMLLTQAGMLARYHRHPGVLSLMGVVLTGGLAWFAHPLLSVLVLPLFLIYYFTVGHRHRLVWHVPLFLGLATAVGANWFWLSDLIAYSWIRVPPARETPLLSQRTLQAWWNAPLWGGGLDKCLTGLLIVGGATGVIVLHRAGQRATARLFGMGMLGLLLLALAGTGWEPFARLGSSQLLAPALFFASVPTAILLAHLLEQLRRWTGSVLSPAFVVLSLPVLIYLAFPHEAERWARTFYQPQPLELGLGAARQALVATLRTTTSDTARILWEDRRTDRGESRWPALLPLLTERAFVGGLDAEAGIEHAITGLVEARLAGRALREWTDAELQAYCQKYNIGWIVCSSPEARARFARWSLAGPSYPLGEIGRGEAVLFKLSRQGSYALTGEVTWRSADVRGILLADARPQPVPNEKEGQVVLSLHYQEGMRVRPARVRLERAVDPQDSIPFVRLRMTAPVGRILITWEGR